jgi:hypothetical protein
VAQVQDAVQRRAQAGPVGAGLAVQQRRVFDGLEELVHGVHLLDLGRRARVQLDVVERDAELLAGFLLQGVGAVAVGAAQVDDAAQAELCWYLRICAGLGWLERYMPPPRS